MKRVILAALIAAAFFLALHRPAFAMVEFCPAQLNYQRVGPESEIEKPGALFGFNLSALGPRTITQATLAFDTSAGWYTLDVPAVTLIEKDRHYSAPWVSFVRRDYVSPKMYVRFALPLTIAHAWLYTVAAQDDGAFGWQHMGAVNCDPPPAASPEQLKRFGPQNRDRTYELNTNDRDFLDSPPAATSLILSPRASPALENETCSEPFRDATVDHEAMPHYPNLLEGMISGESTTSVEVAIEPNGKLQDAWVWGPSGVTAFDDAALRAARDSTYTNARAYCKAVPGRYFFRVTFDPNG